MPTTKVAAIVAATPAFALIADFDIPMRGDKYPWATMTEGQTAIYETADVTVRQRIMRSATAASKRHGIKFAQRQLPPGTKYPATAEDGTVVEKVMASGGLAIKHIGVRPKAIKKPAKKAVAPAAGKQKTA